MRLVCLSLCCLQAVQHAQQALQAAEDSSQQQQQGSMVAPTIALIALLLSARWVQDEQERALAPQKKVDHLSAGAVLNHRIQLCPRSGGLHVPRLHCMDPQHHLLLAHTNPSCVPALQLALICCRCCRQQPQDALTVVEAGLAKLQPSDRCDHTLTASGTSGSTTSSSSASSMALLPRFNDVLLLRVQAQLLLALSDANRAVAVLGTAVRRLAHARRALEARPSLAGGVADKLLREQEAQVCGLLQAVCLFGFIRHAAGAAGSTLSALALGSASVLCHPFAWAVTCAGKLLAGAPHRHCTARAVCSCLMP